MTDEQTPPAEPPAEPQVTLKHAVARPTQDKPAEKAKEVLQQISQELSPELLAKVESLVESSTSSAVDGHRRKMEAEFDKRIASEGYIKPEEVDRRIEQAAEQQRREAEASRNLDRTLASLGIQPDSEEYAKVETAFAEGLKAGTFTHGTLLSETGIKAVAFAADVPQPKAPETPDLPGLRSHGVIQAKDPDAKPGDLDQQAYNSMLKGIQG